MNKLEQAARQILEAVERIGFCSDYWDEKVTALREALAEHEKREPVAWGSTNETGEVFDCVSNQCKTNYPHMVDFDLPLYAAPVSAKRELVDLTCQEITALIMEGAAGGGWQGFAERVLAAFKEKNK